MGIEDSPLRDRVIFVEGAPRSGTTFLTAMLSGHEEIAGITGEPRVFEQGVGTLFDNHEMGGHLDTFVSRKQLVELIRRFVDEVLERLRETTRPSARFVVEKTPVTRRAPTQVLRRKLECYPDGWYLHIVRDGDAVTRSLSRAPWSQDMTEDERSAWWRDSVSAVREVLGGRERYREIRYEDLAADPVAAMEGIFAWLGLECSDETKQRLRLLATERYADLGPIEDAEGARTRPPDVAEGRAPERRKRSTRLLARATRTVARRLRSRLEKRRAASVANEFARAFRGQDADALERLVNPGAELSAHSGEGDLNLTGAEALSGLLAISGRIFAGKFLSESWTLLESPSPSVLFSGTRHDGTRSDAWWVLVIRRGRIDRIGLMVPGPAGGRTMEEWELSSEGQLRAGTVPRR